MTEATIKRVVRAAPWVAILLACVQLALTTRARLATCPALVVATDTGLARTDLTPVANPGTPRDHLLGRGHSFDQDLGGFRLDCQTTNDGHYWDYDHCVLEVPGCASEPLSIDRYGLFTADLELRRAKGGAYAITTRSGSPYLWFRAEPTGRRVGVALVSFSLLVLGLSLASLVVRQRARARAKKFAGWHDGVVLAGHTVGPEDGGPRLPLATEGLAEGTSVLFAPPRTTADYRSLGDPIEAREGSSDELLQSSALLEERALQLAATAMALSVATATIALASA